MTNKKNFGMKTFLKLWLKSLALLPNSRYRHKRIALPALDSGGDIKENKGHEGPSTLEMGCGFVAFFLCYQ